MKSPCVKICKLIDSVCIGCGRTSEQITEWTKYTDKKREEIIKEIQLNHCQVLSNNYDIVFLSYPLNLKFLFYLHLQILS